ncbi:Beta-lactamase hydrolase-family protein [Burkholderia sp. MR1]|nr:Beta-lactamase hydrolase-family protein [Burkholderia sp. MR1]
MSENIKHASPEVVVGGQPSLQDLSKAKDQGVRAVLNLRPEHEAQCFNEQAEVERLGMRYLTLPIADASDLNRAAASKLDTLLGDPENRPIWFHCGSGNRVGALFALRAAWIEGMSLEAAIEVGRQHGLTKMEPDVRSILR